MKVFLLFPFFIHSLALAEYRVFNLKITKQSADKTQPPISRTVQSTLDPVQYKDLYYVAPDEYVDYTETWMCKGRTDYVLEFCPNPRAAEPGLPQSKAQIPPANISNQNTP